MQSSIIREKVGISKLGRKTLKGMWVRSCGNLGRELSAASVKDYANGGVYESATSGRSDRFERFDGWRGVWSERARLKFFEGGNRRLQQALCRIAFEDG